MRLFAFASLLALAACSGDQAADNAAAEEAAKASLKLASGQWETTSEITRMTRKDAGTPKMKADVGTRTATNACVAEGEGKRPPAAVLAGIENADCTYQNIYMSRGRINASISCTRPDLKGNVLVSVDGTYTDKTFEAASSVGTALSTDGDVEYSAKVTGRHTGACAAAPAKAG